MAQYHVNNRGNPGECHALVGNCPFGSSEEHFDTPAAARTAYEQAQTHDLFKGIVKPASGEKNLRELEEARDELYGERNTVINAINQIKANIETLEANEAKAEASSSERVSAYEREAGLHKRFTFINSRLEDLDKQIVIASRDDSYVTRVNIDTFDSQRVMAMAKFATNHNSGNTVIETHEVGDAVFIRMSSWPRAQEAAKKFKEKGWVPEFTGDSRGGELLKVYNPATTSRTFKNAKDFFWHGEEKTFTMEASEFGYLPMEGFSFISQKDGNAVSVIPHREMRDNEDEVTGWEYKPTNPAHNWTITIFND